MQLKQELMHKFKMIKPTPKQLFRIQYQQKVQELESQGFSLTHRTMGDIKALFSPEYHECNFPFNSDEETYFFADKDKVDMRIPHQTFLPNFPEHQGYTIMGCTFGHTHTQKEKGDTRRFQEIYEFHGFGAMLLRNPKETTLHILPDRGKVIVGTEDNMTFYNLDNQPLITQDIANQEKDSDGKLLMNSAHKNLEAQLGTFMLLKTKPGKLEFHFNKHYFADPEGIGFVDGDFSPLHIPLMFTPHLGASILVELSQNQSKYQEEFAKRGIKLSIGSNIPEDLEKPFTPSLEQLTKESKPILFKELQITY
jgi:hypothetical protein